MNKRKLFFAIIILFGALSAHSQTLKEAIKLTESEQFDMASNAFQNLLSREPANGTFYYYYGENYLLAENEDSAKILYTKGLQSDPANVLNIIGLAKIDLNNGNAEAGNKSIDVAIQKAGPKNALAYTEAADALIHLKSKNLDKALQLLDKAIVLDMKNPDILILYGDLYSEQNNGSKAAEYYNRAIELDKTSVRAIVSKGKLYKRSTNFEGAAEEFVSAINIAPGYAPAHRELGETYFRLGKIEKAKEEYRKYLELSKNNTTARIRNATFLYLSKDYTGALNEINQLQKNDGNNITLLRVQSYCYYELKEYAKGLETMEKLMTKLDTSKIAVIDHEYYGKLLIASNKDSLGIVELKRAYELAPPRVDFLTEIGNANFKIKKYSDAAAAFNEKISLGKEVKPTDYMQLGKSYFFNQQFDNADAVFNRLCEVSPKWASAFLWNAKNKTRIDSTSKAALAKPYYEKYIEFAMADSVNIPTKYAEGLKEAYSYLASYYYLQLNDKTSTLAYLKKKMALVDDPAEKKEISTMIDQLENKK